jgi:hypothetical protein
MSQIDGVLVTKMQATMREVAEALAGHMDESFKKMEEHLGKQLEALNLRKEADGTQHGPKASDTHQFRYTLTSCKKGWTFLVPGMNRTSSNPGDLQVSEEKRAMDKKVKALEAAAEARNAERSELIEEKRYLIGERDSLALIAADRDKDRQKIRQLEQRLAESKTKVAKLSSIIVKGGQQDDTLDEEKLLQGFRDLQYMANDITRCYYQSLNARPWSSVDGHRDDEEKQQHSKRWANWASLSVEERNHYVRSLIFGAINRKIFKKPCFGPDERMELQLGNFELALEDDKNGKQKRPSSVGDD